MARILPFTVSNPYSDTYSGEHIYEQAHTCPSQYRHRDDVGVAAGLHAGCHFDARGLGRQTKHTRVEHKLNDNSRNSCVIRGWDFVRREANFGSGWNVAGRYVGGGHAIIVRRGNVTSWDKRGQHAVFVGGLDIASWDFRGRHAVFVGRGNIASRDKRGWDAVFVGGLDIASRDKRGRHAVFVGSLDI